MRVCPREGEGLCGEEGRLRVVLRLVWPGAEGHTLLILVPAMT